MTSPLPDTTIDAALAYTGIGWAVIPIRPGEKRPVFDKWQNVASADPDTITPWWTDDSRLGVGIVCGHKSGIWVLDVDGPDGRKSLKELTDAYGELPDTPVSITGKGLHIIFACPEALDPVTNRGQLGPGLDVRGTGGQILAPPTVHPSGVPYRWAENHDPFTLTPVRAPGWLEHMVQRPTNTTTPVELTPRKTQQPDDDLGALAEHTYGTLHDLLATDGWAATRQTGDSTYWVRPGKDARDGISAITHNGQVLVVFSTNAPPELLEGNRTVTGDGYVHNLFSYIAATRFAGDRSAAAIAIRTETGTLTPKTGDTEMVADGLIGTDIPGHPEYQNPLRTRAATETELETLKPPEPVAQGWLYRNTLAVIYGPPKSGKTFLAIDIAMATARGHLWSLGATTRTPVLYVAAEGVYGVSRRAAAWRDHHNTATGDITFLKGAIQLSDPADVDNLSHLAVDLNAGLLVIDTLARCTVGSEENSARDAGLIVASLDRIKERTGACVLAVHHTGKDADRGMRGSNALDGAVDTAIQVDGDVQTMQVTNRYQKDAEPAESAVLRCVKAADSLVATRWTGGIDLEAAPTKMTAARQELIRVAKARRTTSPLNRTEWCDRATGRAGTLRAAFDDMVFDGWFIAVEGTEGAHGKHAAKYKIKDNFDQ